MNVNKKRKSDISLCVWCQSANLHKKRRGLGPEMEDPTAQINIDELKKHGEISKKEYFEYCSVPTSKLLTLDQISYNPDLQDFAENEIELQLKVMNYGYDFFIKTMILYSELLVNGRKKCPRLLNGVTNLNFASNVFWC